MILKAQIPAIPESRLQQMPARLARKVGPLFGVPWDGAPGGMRSWCCDYSQLTLAEIMRGAPRLAKASELGGYEDRGVHDDVVKKGHAVIANATAARFGPDTKAAFVLVGANVLLRPVTDALCKALREVPVDDPQLLIGAYAYCLIEVFRSEPILLIAALQAQGVQRALGAVVVPVRTADVTGLASHEFGPDRVGYDRENAPMSLELVERLAEVLCDRLEPRERVDVDASESIPGGNAQERLRRTVVGMAQATLFDMTAGAVDATVRVVDTAEGRSGEVLLMTSARMQRFAHAVSVHVQFPEGATESLMADKLSVLGDITEGIPLGSDIDCRAALTVRRGLLTAALALFQNRDESSRYLRGRMIEALTERVREQFGEDSADYRLERVKTLADLIHFPAAGDEDPRDPHVVTRRAQWLDEALPRAHELLAATAEGRIDAGHLAERLPDLLVAVNQIRREVHRAPVEGLPDARELTRRLLPLWDGYRKVLASFFGEESRQYQYRQHNYSAFLVGQGSPPDLRARGLALFDEQVIPMRREAVAEGALFVTLRGPLQVATRGHVAFAREHDDPATRRAHLATARSYAREVLEKKEETRRLLGETGATTTSGFIMATALAECFLYSAEFASSAEEEADRADWITLAADLLRLAAPYVSGDSGKPRNRADRKRAYEALHRKLIQLTGTGAQG
ncbi:hypothetical protein PV396_26585 [Streptomyces sp. ME02-8801-2C]|uniref:hypothetical protein n=1 Tax=Streptomyces sp. ME02-8801-2C TaxID=3028680 RepID=UPI0029BB83FE|nr:hypothetical protein [Streptomyces sp. ME02-8801-2C]MDX3455460.1 hypothetical protein [Streptomyces sp. ME02-8801-2C]